jgi:large-conductance mechanosensitive channel
VVVQREEAIDKLIDLSSKVDAESLNESVVGFLDRLQYTYHFAKTIDRVPEILPYENGKNWLASLEFTTTPRILNPDKPLYEATVKTKKYTGIKYLGQKDGVSFSLGYFPDSYIDFGIYGMMVFLMALGIMYALVYRYLLKNASTNVVFNYATVGAFFLEFNALEMDSTYLLGRFFASLVTFVFLVKFVFPMLIKSMSKSAHREEDASYILHR